MKKILTLFAAMLVFFSQLADAQVVLNEIKVRPKGAASSPPNGFFFNGGEEYVELYNNGCAPVDITGYFIATRQSLGGSSAVSGGTLRLPNVTIQPKSHLVIASPSAARAEDIDVKLTTANVPACFYNRSFAIVNIDGWIALYDASGIPLDGVYWSSNPGNLNSQPSDYGGTLCVPTGSPVTSLPNPQQIGTSIMRYGGGNFNNSADSLLSRQTDGTGKWVRNLPSSIKKSSATKNCNGGVCYDPETVVTSFSYPSPSCANSTLAPTTIPGFTSGGVFTASEGVSIDSSTGVINVAASIPGTYQINYTVARVNCSGKIISGSGTASIIIPDCCPEIPVIASTAPTCIADGNSFIANYNSSVRYIFNPAGPVVDTGGTIFNMVPEISYTVSANFGFCTSAPSIAFSKATALPSLFPVISCVSSTDTSVTFQWNKVLDETSYSVAYIVNVAKYPTPINITANSFTVLSTPDVPLATGDSVTIVVTPQGSSTDTCFGTASKTCYAVICAPISAGSIIGANQVCSDSTTTLFNQNATAPGIWSSGNTSIATIDAAGLVTPQAPGMTTISYTAFSNTVGCPNDIATFDLTVIEKPNPEIDWDGTKLITTFKGDFYQWYFNDVLIPGADSDTYKPTKNGFYTVMVYSKGCYGMSAKYNFIATNLISLTPSFSKSLLVYPNPAQHNVWIKLDRKPGERMDLQMFNAVGGLVKSLQSGQQQLDLNVADLPAGTYFIRVSAPGYREVKKIQIAK